MEFHEIANLFPMMIGDEYRLLREDIAANGLIEPITTYQGKILDGRNRYIACLDLNIDPQFIEWNENISNPLDFVISKNLHRRHLNESQRATIAAKLANLEWGQRTNRVANLPVYTQPEAAALMNISERSIRTVKAIERNAPELMTKLESGEMTVNEANTIIRRNNQAEKAKILAAPELPDKHYSIIYADPPWQYDYSLTSNREIENQYPTMQLEEICKLDIQKLCANDCVLFLWATNPKLMEAFAVLNAWGFQYKTNMVWIKDKIGMGYYARQRHELLLIATRGNLAVPLPENRPDSVIKANRGKHSEKPKIVYELINRMYPGIPKLELFARETREGWNSWGNQL